jgi:hypothetical protein
MRRDARLLVAVGAIGVAAYLDRELLARYVVPTHDYTVGAVRRLGSRVVELALDPVRRALAFEPGQFVILQARRRAHEARALGGVRRPLTSERGRWLDLAPQDLPCRPVGQRLLEPDVARVLVRGHAGLDECLDVVGGGVAAGLQ